MSCAKDETLEHFNKTYFYINVYYGVMYIMLDINFYYTDSKIQFISRETWSP